MAMQKMYCTLRQRRLIHPAVLRAIKCADEIVSCVHPPNQKKVEDEEIVTLNLCKMTPAVVTSLCICASMSSAPPRSERTDLMRRSVHCFMIYVPAEMILYRFAFVCVSCNCCCFLLVHVNSLRLKCGPVKAGV